MMMNEPSLQQTLIVQASSTPFMPAQVLRNCWSTSVTHLNNTLPFDVFTCVPGEINIMD